MYRWITPQWSIDGTKVSIFAAICVGVRVNCVFAAKKHGRIDIYFCFN